ncbi:MAG: hypothetical protein A2Y24_01390 [Clostridiales bacterium GWE2_32_10]|nr:MAG: hypothetical protein A2Y24_01390 [Clostridiales bacterium GWE2_32_10]HBY19982.1 hypothetical protein [Clostridiales bacterium]
MEKLTYINSDGQQIELGKERPYILLSRDNLNGLNGEIETQKSPLQKGESYIDTNINGRDIAIVIGIVENSKEQLENAKQELMRVFNAELGEGKLYYRDDFKERYIKAIVEKGAVMKDNGDNKANNFQKCLISIYASDPYWYEKEENEVELASIIGGLEFDLEIMDEYMFEQDGSEVEVINQGTTEAGVEIEFNGPAQNPRVINLTTGKYVQIDTILDVGEKLIINTNDDNVEITLNDETGISDAFNLINIDSELWKLRRGLNAMKQEVSQELILQQ